MLFAEPRKKAFSFDFFSLFGSISIVSFVRVRSLASVVLFTFCRMFGIYYHKKAFSFFLLEFSLTVCVCTKEWKNLDSIFFRWLLTNGKIPSLSFDLYYRFWFFSVSDIFCYLFSSSRLSDESASFFLHNHRSWELLDIYSKNQRKTSKRIQIQMKNNVS